METIHGLAELEAIVGKEIGPTDWFTVDQARVDGFADGTEDHQWIHVDLERALAGPLRGPVKAAGGEPVRTRGPAARCTGAERRSGHLPRARRGRTRTTGVSPASSDGAGLGTPAAGARDRYKSLTVRFIAGVTPAGAAPGPARSGPGQAVRPPEDRRIPGWPGSIPGWPGSTPGWPGSGWRAGLVRCWTRQAADRPAAAGIRRHRRSRGMTGRVCRPSSTGSRRRTRPRGRRCPVRRTLRPGRRGTGRE